MTSIITKSNQQRVVDAQKETANPSHYWSDQLYSLFGTTNIQAILGQIGDTGEPWEKQINDYLNTLPLTPAVPELALLETGDTILLETGDGMLLE